MYTNNKVVVAARDTATPISKRPTNTTPFNYYHQRIIALGLDRATAIQHGLVSNAQGAILQLCRDYAGEHRQYLPQKELLDSGKLLEEDIVIITREVVNTGQHPIFNEIIQHERIKSSVKLILSTCLIAEGIDITNQNIGKVFKTLTHLLQCANT